jgi:integrase
MSETGKSERYEKRVKRETGKWKRYIREGKLETKLRIDEALHQHLTEEAAKKGVSLNAEVRARLEASLEYGGGAEAEKVKRDINPPAPQPQPADDSKKVAALQAEIAQLRDIVSRRASALPGKLSATKIAQLLKKANDGNLKSRWFGDGGNLWLQITNNGGGVSWIFRWTEPGTGRERNIGFGSYPDVDLDMAREKARQSRLMLREGKDPKAERDSRRLDDEITRGLAKTVSQVANEYFDRKLARKTEGTRSQVAKWLKTFVHDTIGDMPIQKVDRKTILQKCELADLWTGQHPTALGLRNHLDRMFSFAIASKYYHGENPAAWEGLQHVLPSSADVHRVKHHAALPCQDIGRFMQKLRAYEDPRGAGRGGRTTVSLAVEFVVLTGVRLNEVRLAQWKEIDIEHMVWNVPPEHLKTGHLHGKMRPIPITKPMLAVLEEAQKRRRDQSPDAVLFPAQWSKDGLLHRENFSTFIRKQLGWEIHVTIHGFRSTLRDWCRANKFPGEWWDIQVDHVLGDKTSQSYGHNPLLEERRRMMEQWGEYCSKPAPEPQTGDVVVNLADKRRPA